MPIFKGSGVAIVTPFNQDGSVNFDALAKLIEFQIEGGTDAIISCGTTGEASTLTDEEQVEVIEFTVSTTKKRVPVVAGGGTNDTRHGVNLCKAIEKTGVDGLLLVTPYYNKTTPKGLIAHYTEMAKATDLPCILYSVPSRTGVNISPFVCEALSKIDNIVGIKEASGNISQVAEIADIARNSSTEFDIYSGNDDQIVPILSLGGIGVISVVANIAPKQTHDLVMHYLNGDIKASLDEQLKMLKLVNSLFCEVNPIPVKQALNIMGYEVGGYRMPLIEMEDENVSYLRDEMKKYGLI